MKYLCKQNNTCTVFREFQEAPLTYNNLFYNKCCRPSKSTLCRRPECSCTDSTAGRRHATSCPPLADKIDHLSDVHNQHTLHHRSRRHNFLEASQATPAAAALALVCDARRTSAAGTVPPVLSVGEGAGAGGSTSEEPCRCPNRRTGGCCWTGCCRNCRWRRWVPRPPLTSRTTGDSAKGRGMDRTPGQCTARAAAEI